MAEEESRDAHTACEEGNLWSIQNFVKTKTNFDIDAPDHTGRTCLMLAAEAGHEKIVEFLIAHNANITKKDQFNKRSAIHLACRKVRLVLFTISIFFGGKGASDAFSRVPRERPLLE